MSAGFNCLSLAIVAVDGIFVVDGGLNYDFVAALGVLRAVGMPILLALS